LTSTSGVPRSRFRRVDERTLHEGYVISLGVGTFEAPDGRRFDRDVVHHPGAVSVVPLLDDDTVVMVRQYRAALDRDLLEIPAGKRDIADEPPDTTARRELVEEIGWHAHRLDLLAEFFNSPGFCDEHSWVYLARDLEARPTDLQGIEEEHLVVEHIRLDDVPAMIADARIVDAKSIIGLMMTRHALGR
jgi:ADP-ribose pyrophosphatase